MSNNNNNNNKDEEEQEQEDNNNNNSKLKYGFKENTKHSNTKMDLQIPIHFKKFKKFSNSFYNSNFERDKINKEKEDKEKEEKNRLKKEKKEKKKQERELQQQQQEYSDSDDDEQITYGRKYNKKQKIKRLDDSINIAHSINQTTKPKILQNYLFKDDDQLLQKKQKVEKQKSRDKTIEKKEKKKHDKKIERNQKKHKRKNTIDISSESSEGEEEGEEKTSIKVKVEKESSQTKQQPQQTEQEEYESDYDGEGYYVFEDELENGFVPLAKPEPGVSTGIFVPLAKSEPGLQYNEDSEEEEQFDIKQEKLPKVKLEFENTQNITTITTSTTTTPTTTKKKEKIKLKSTTRPLFTVNKKTGEIQFYKDGDSDNENQANVHTIKDEIRLFGEREEEISTINKIKERQNTFPSLFPHYNKFTNVHASVSLHNPFIRADHGFRFILYRFPHLKSSNIKSYNFSRNQTLSHLFFDPKQSLDRSKSNISQFLKENQFLDPLVERFCHKQLLNHYRNRKVKLIHKKLVEPLKKQQEEEKLKLQKQEVEDQIKKLQQLDDSKIKQNLQKEFQKVTTKEAALERHRSKLRPLTRELIEKRAQQQDNGNVQPLLSDDDDDEDEYYSDGSEYDPIEDKNDELVNNIKDDVYETEIDIDTENETDFENENEGYIKIDEYGIPTFYNNNNNNGKKRNSNFNFNNSNINYLTFNHLDKTNQFNERMFGGNRLHFENINQDKFVILATGPIMNILSVYDCSNGKSFPLEYNYEVHSIAYYQVSQTILNISITQVSINLKIICIRTKYSVYYLSMKYTRIGVNSSEKAQIIKIELLNSFTFSDRVMDVCISKKIINQSFVLLENSSIFKLNFNLQSVSSSLVKIEPFELIPPIIEQQEKTTGNGNGGGGSSGRGEEQQHHRSYQWMRFKLNQPENQIILSCTNKIILFDISSEKIKTRTLLTSSKDEKGIINGFEVVEGYPFHLVVSTDKYLFLFDTRYVENPLICFKNPKEHTLGSIGNSNGGFGINIKVLQHLIQKNDDLIFILIQNNISGDIFIFQYTFGRAPTSLSLPFIPIIGTSGSISSNFFESPFQTLLKSTHSAINTTKTTTGLMSEIYQTVPCSTPFTPIQSFGERSAEISRDSNHTCNPYTSYPLVGVCMVPTVIHNLVGITLLQMNLFGDITSTVYLLQDIISTEAKHEQLLDERYRLEQLKKIENQKLQYQKSSIYQKFADRPGLIHLILKRMENSKIRRQSREQARQKRSIHEQSTSNGDDEDDQDDKNAGDLIDDVGNKDGLVLSEIEKKSILEDLDEIKEIFSTQSTSISETSSIAYNLISLDQLVDVDEKNRLTNFNEFSRSLDQHINISKLNDKRNNQSYYGGRYAKDQYWTNVKTKSIPTDFNIIDRKSKTPWNSVNFDTESLGQAIEDLLEYGPQTTSELIGNLNGFFLKYEVLEYLDSFSILPTDLDNKTGNSNGVNKHKPIFKTKVKPNYSLLNRDKINGSGISGSGRNGIDDEDEDTMDFIEFNSTVYHLDPFFSIERLKSQPLFLKTRHRFTNKDYKGKDSVRSKYDKIYDENDNSSSKQDASQQQSNEYNDEPQSIADIYRQEELEREKEKENQSNSGKGKKKLRSHYKVVVRSSFYPEDWKKEWADGYSNINSNSNDIVSKFSKYSVKDKRKKLSNRNTTTTTTTTSTSACSSQQSSSTTGIKKRSVIATSSSPLKGSDPGTPSKRSRVNHGDSPISNYDNDYTGGSSSVGGVGDAFSQTSTSGGYNFSSQGGGGTSGFGGCGFGSFFSFANLSQQTNLGNLFSQEEPQQSQKQQPQQEQQQQSSQTSNNNSNTNNSINEGNNNDSFTGHQPQQATEDYSFFSSSQKSVGGFNSGGGNSGFSNFFSQQSLSQQAFQSSFENDKNVNHPQQQSTSQQQNSNYKDDNNDNDDEEILPSQSGSDYNFSSQPSASNCRTQ